MSLIFRASPLHFATLTILSLGLWAGPLWGASPQGAHTTHGVSITSAAFQLALWPKQHTLRIRADLKLKSTRPLQQLKLFLPQLIQLKKIELHPAIQGQKATHTRQLATAVVKFQRPQSGTFGLRVTYQIVFHSRKNYLFKAIFCRIDPSESYLLYGWYPSTRPFADPLTGRLLGSKRYPYTMALEVPKGQIGLSSGPLLRKQRLASGRTLYQYRQPAIKEAAIFFTSSNFRRITRKSATGTKLSFYLHPQDKGRNLKQLAKMVARTQALYQRLWGSPVSPAQAKQGAARHWRLISFGGSGARGYPFTLLLDRNQDYFDGDLNAAVDSLFTRRQVLLHELAHTWWGNAVTGIGKGSIWLNEGLANYASLRAIGALYGPKAEAAALRRHVRYFLRGKGSAALLAPGGLAQMAGRIAYTKGALVFYELERRLGRKVVERGLHRFFQRHRGTFATIAHLQKDLEHAAKRSLTTFFRDWIYGEGLPFIQRTAGKKPWRCVPKGRRCRLHVALSNTGRITGSAIVHVLSKRGVRKVYTKLVPPGTHTITLDVPFQVAKVKLDPQGIMLHGLRLQALMNKANQLRRSGQLPRAAALFRSLVALAPKHSQGLYSFGLLRQKQGKVKQAMGLFSRAFAPKVTGPWWVPLWARYRYALLLRKQGKPAKAKTILRKLLLQPQDPYGLKARIRSTP